MCSYAGGQGKSELFLRMASISRLARVMWVITSPRMTRQSIEGSVKLFLIALIITFVITVLKVFAMLGWL